MTEWAEQVPMKIRIIGCAALGVLVAVGIGVLAYRVQTVHSLLWSAGYAIVATAALGGMVALNVLQPFQSEEEPPAGTPPAAVLAGPDERAGVFETMEVLPESTLLMAKAIQVIRDLARQTSLVSLNAAIAAAKVGDDGHGFAHVADEAQKLADRSQGSAAEIEALITRGLGSGDVSRVAAMLARRNPRGFAAREDMLLAAHHS